jgi:hypothetical protein
MVIDCGRLPSEPAALSGQYGSPKGPDPEPQNVAVLALTAAEIKGQLLTLI